MAEANEDTPQGLAFALTAYLLWGFLPLYMKLLSHIPPVEIIAHRMIWSIPVAGLVVWATGRTADLKAAIRNPRMLSMAVLTATLVALNWGIYVWSITSGNAMQAALGYYINPLFSVLLASVLLRERLSRTQWIAIGMAASAVVILTIDAGRLPIAALGMTVTWGLYAYFKKSLPIGPNQAFMLEVLILLPFALGWLIHLGPTGVFGQSGAGDVWLLLGVGPVSAIPLIVYANGAKRLRLSTIGILQYIAPTMIFLIAVFVFDEPFGTAQSLAFPLIWAALMIYSASMLRTARKARRGRVRSKAGTQNSS
jgi:chloramphenicol-sensitive protein RarD